QLLERRVGAGDVRLVVLVMVEFHDLTGDVRLQRTIVVRQVRQRVLSHADSTPSLGCERYSRQPLPNLPRPPNPSATAPPEGGRPSKCLALTAASVRPAGPA